MSHALLRIPCYIPITFHIRARAGHGLEAYNIVQQEHTTGTVAGASSIRQPCFPFCTGPATAPPLADALCRLVTSSHSSLQPRNQQQQQQHSGHPSGPRWSSHPLVAALLSCPAAATQLLASAMTALGQEAAAAEAEAEAAVATGPGVGGASPSDGQAWAALEPFFSWVLLQVRGGRHGMANHTRALYRTSVHCATFTRASLSMTTYSHARTLLVVMLAKRVAVLLHTLGTAATRPWRTQLRLLLLRGCISLVLVLSPDSAGTLAARPAGPCGVRGAAEAAAAAAALPHRAPGPGAASG